ncbi:phosphotransferase [Pseudocolwellia sp. AS88]|uniref:phosphotransferase n=1 Tax=Pseudocolwellia sp. AS88 TaxID=3063958 RepID=UPI0026FBCD94|nr:phosphotransferase [Pseudocolwellia sp. AS88]
MNLHEQKQLCERIKVLPCFNLCDGESLSVTKIETGQSSSCFDVSIINTSVHQSAKNHSTIKRYFVKYETNSESFKNELKVSNAASKIKLSPKLIYTDQNWLVNEFIEAVSLDKVFSHIKNKIEIAIELMKQCHTLDVSIPEFNFSEIITHIIKSKSFSVSQVKHIKFVLDVISTIENKPQNKPLVCHGDVNFSNIMTLNNKAWLVDFECACLAEKEYDLAMFMAINFLNADEQAYTVTCYEKFKSPDNIKVDQKKLAQYLSYAYLINGLWYFDKAQGLQGSEMTEFHDLAVQQLTQFDKRNPENTVLSQLFP